MSPAESHLRSGGVVAAPTETFYGLLVDATNPAAIDALFALKPRGAASALIIPEVDAWARLVTHVPPSAARLASAFWPGPLTIVLPATRGLDARLLVDGTVGVRVPGASAGRALCQAFGGPLTATSANVPGALPATDGAQVRASFTEAVDSGRLFVMEGRCPGGRPSSIVRCRGETIEVLREGAIPVTDIEAAARAAL